MFGFWTLLLHISISRVGLTTCTSTFNRGCQHGVWIWVLMGLCPYREQQLVRSCFKRPWDRSYSCRVSAKLETDSSCPCALFIQRFFHSVLWPPLSVAPTAYLGGAGSLLAQFRESQSLPAGHQGDESWGTEGCNLMCFCRRGSPLLIGVRSEHKLSTDHIPILYRTGKHQHPLPRTFPNTQTHGRAETTHTCVLWNTC